MSLVDSILFPRCNGHRDLHSFPTDALPIFHRPPFRRQPSRGVSRRARHVGRGHAILGGGVQSQDRKSTRLNSSHTVISYAVFCLKKKNKTSKEANMLKVMRHTLSATLRSEE